MKRTRTELETELAALGTKRRHLEEELDRVTESIQAELSATEKAVKTTRRQIKELEAAELAARQLRVTLFSFGILLRHTPAAWKLRFFVPRANMCTIARDHAVEKRDRCKSFSQEGDMRGVYLYCPHDVEDLLLCTHCKTDHALIDEAVMLHFRCKSWDDVRAKTIIVDTLNYAGSPAAEEQFENAKLAAFSTRLEDRNRPQFTLDEVREWARIEEAAHVRYGPRIYKPLPLDDEKWLADCQKRLNKDRTDSCFSVLLEK